MSTSWPNYPIGPRDSVFAIGVASVNYAQLELAVQAMCAAILKTDNKFTGRLLAKIGPEMKDKIMREGLSECDWPTDAKELVSHFVDAHKICYDNRNKLIHSSALTQMTGNKVRTILHKTHRSGEPIFSYPTIDQLRKVADDMKTYFWIGLNVATLIRTEIHGIKPQEGDFASWPHKPPLPILLEYTSDPIQGG